MDGEASAASASTSDWEVLSQHLFDLQVESRSTACRLRSEICILACRLCSTIATSIVLDCRGSSSSCRESVAPFALFLNRMAFE